MTKQTRYFMFGSVAVLIAGLAVGLVAYYGGFPGMAFQTSPPNELRYVPEDAAIVGYANVQEVMRSDFRQKIKGMEPGHVSSGQQEFKEQTGIDIESDIYSVLVFLAPGGNEEAMVLARGYFNDGRIQSFLTSKGAVAEEYGGVWIYSEDKDASRKKVSVAFLEPGLVAVGPAATVKGAIDRAGAGANDILANAQMVNLINSVRADGNAWAVGRFDALAERAELPDEVMSRMPSVSSFAAAGQINGGLAGRLSIEAKDAEAARNLTQVIDGFVALARLQFGSSPEHARLLDSLNLRSEGRDNVVDISFALSPALLDALQQMGRKRLPDR